MTSMDSSTLILLKDASVYREDELILSRINLKVEKSDFIYVIGKVGEGKTSLIKSLIGEIPFRDGETIVAGFDLRKIKARQIPMLRRKIGIVFQDFQLLNDRTVDENLRFVLKATGWKNDRIIREQINKVLESTGMQNKGYKMPHQLSGGEQQRIVISRALLNDPELILADEPTGNLDPETSLSIMDVLTDLRKNGVAVLMATHNYSLLKRYPFPTYRCDKNRFLPLSPDEEPVSVSLEAPADKEEIITVNEEIEFSGLFEDFEIPDTAPDDQESPSEENVQPLK